MKTLTFLTALSLLNILTSCGSSSSKNYWEGESTTETEKLAEKSCDCIANVMKAAGIDLDNFMKMDPERMAKDAQVLTKKEMKEKYKDLLPDLEKFSGIEMGLHSNSCFRDLEKEVEEKNINEREFQNALKRKCKLLPML